MVYGLDRSRFHENKRAVEDKNLGPLIKTIMTRCIHCTRCVRFATEIAGVSELGATGRGEHMEIGTYVERALTSELSGNMIDLCPVGALTSKPYAFVARSWELTKTESVDVLDAVGSNIRIDSRGREVMRILPRLNEDVNEEWISDKTRFACDGLKRQRLDRPFVRRDGRLLPASWSEAFDVIAARLLGVAGDRIAAIAGDLVDCEAMFALKQLMAALGSPHLDCRQDGARLDATLRAAYLFNTTIAGIEAADACLLIGTNPRREAAIVNARLRKRYVAGEFPVALLGPEADLTYPHDHLGNDPRVLSEIHSGTHAFAGVLEAAERPMLVLGMGALARTDGAAVLHLARGIAERFGMIDADADWNGFNVLHTAAARAGGLDLGFLPGTGGRDRDGIVEGAAQGGLDVIYLLGADALPMDALGDAFVIYQGHHGDAGAHRADVILPGAAYTEKNATYVNTEGRVQWARLAVDPPGEAREDWTVIRALSDVLGRTLPFDTLDQLRGRMVAAHPVLGTKDRIQPASWGAFGTEGSLASEPLHPAVDDFYLFDPVSRASITMAQCSEVAVGSKRRKTGTDG